jgi:hypothetical protein
MQAVPKLDRHGLQFCHKQGRQSDGDRKAAA